MNFKKLQELAKQGESETVEFILLVPEVLGFVPLSHVDLETFFNRKTSK